MGPKKKQKKSSTKDTTLGAQLSQLDNDDKVDEKENYLTNGDVLGKSIPSRIPTLSPQKKKVNKKTSIQDIKTEVETLFIAKDMKKLVELNKMVINPQGPIMSELDKKYAHQLEQLNSIILRLTRENEELQLEIRALKTDRPVANGTKNDDSKSYVFDMIELLLNLSCSDFIEDGEKFQFTMKQTSNSENDLELNYKLILNKSDTIDEILYIPIWSNDDNYNELKEKLPDYFLTELSFPSSNLNNFYNKIARSLNK